MITYTYVNNDGNSVDIASANSVNDPEEIIRIIFDIDKFLTSIEDLMDMYSDKLDSIVGNMSKEEAFALADKSIFGDVDKDGAVFDMVNESYRITHNDEMAG